MLKHAQLVEASVHWLASLEWYFFLKLWTNVHTRMIQGKVQIYEQQMFTVCVLKDIFCWSFVEPIQTFDARNDFVNITRNNIEVSASQSHDMFISVICRRKNSVQCILSPSRSLIQQPASRSAAQADNTPHTSSSNTKLYTQQILIFVYPTNASIVSPSRPGMSYRDSAQEDPITSRKWL